MELEVKINMDNAAFEENPQTEAARILRELADRLEAINSLDSGYLSAHDINGNKVGGLEVTA